MQHGCINSFVFMRMILDKPDILGAFASTLCLFHCMATPLIFIAQAYPENGFKEAFFWWVNLDYLFIIISFLAVARSAKYSANQILKYLLWINWAVLFFLIINEKFHFLSLPEIITYIVAISLAVIHIYNLKFCQCKTNSCCAQNG
ncbi:MerC domain-containing protein [Cyclobacterium marinum]|nr:MerC domain-containing protein [Cyclobacterium marinum]